jgi:anti-sigma-K factor RskA
MNVDSHSLVGAYAVDALDDVEGAAFEAHLAECAMCRAELASLRAAAAALSSLAETPPPARVKDAVLREIRTVRPLPPALPGTPAPAVPGPAVPGPAVPGPAVPAPAPPGDATPAAPGTQPRSAPEAAAGESTSGAQPPTPVSLAERRRRGRAVTWLLAAAAAAVLAIGGLVWSPWNDEAPRLTAVERVLQAPDAQRVERQVGSATATIVRSRSLGQAVIVADHMGAAPAGKDYQLWFEDDAGAMHSAGLMPHSSAERVSVLLQGDATAATGVGITLEPAGGSPEPTSAPLVLFPLA